MKNIDQDYPCLGRPSRTASGVVPTKRLNLGESRVIYFRAPLASARCLGFPLNSRTHRWREENDASVLSLASFQQNRIPIATPIAVWGGEQIRRFLLAYNRRVPVRINTFPNKKIWIKSTYWETCFYKLLIFSPKDNQKLIILLESEVLVSLSYL